MSGSSTITWHVEQAHEPPQAPRTQGLSANELHDLAPNDLRTLHFNVVGLCDVQQVVALGNLEIDPHTVLVNEGHIDPAQALELAYNACLQC